MKSKKTRSTRAKKNPSIGDRILKGFEEAIAWSQGEDLPVRVTHVQVPEVDVLQVRRRMRLSQTPFAQTCPLAFF